MINISDSALDKIKEMIAQEETPNMFLRLGVNPGGCSGFSYGMGLDNEETEEDVYMEVGGMKVVVDKESLRYLNGLEIDFQESGMSGGFTIHNPNAIASCGCGQSFKMRDEEGRPEVCD
ncbi:iron-sulfur cluster assembly accessory protein [Paenibacillus sp. CAA11]|uniref:HesB/IscA family protein n=1 Tax=Paenibacillus sp. CAA11 TaxID=1532905 RepID=UPI000D3A1C68|nr:iron-sulfur cluster assembly accessory protein [Paenibacillus sp. CAA11]AWB45871.1 iron-sulfur cluster assembly accessory protein [Paenibacillus sp. CAA11]